MNGLERLWAGWRSDYVSSAGADREPGENGEGCVMCRVLEADSYVVWRGSRCAAVLNAYPYSSGHLLVIPDRHLEDVEELDGEESGEIWGTVRAGVQALKAAYRPDGINLGANLGTAAGAGLPRHLHLHIVPRWDGDTNFMTTVAGTRVLPESLDASYEKLRSAWPPSIH